MNKALWWSGAAALASLLAACAPSMGNGAGRIVNTVTGQEGQVVFVGGFAARAAVLGAPDNVTVQLGQELYSGTYSVIGQAPVSASASFGFGNSWGGGWGWGHRPFFASDVTAVTPRATVQPGNLVVRTPAPRGKTLSCTFQADQRGHGVGDCQGSDGAHYTLQF